MPPTVSMIRGLVATSIAMPPANSTVLRRPIEMLDPTAVWITVVSAVRRDSTSPVFSDSKNAGLCVSTCAYTARRRSVVTRSPIQVTMKKRAGGEHAHGDGHEEQQQEVFAHGDQLVSDRRVRGQRQAVVDEQLDRVRRGEHRGRGEQQEQRGQRDLQLVRRDERQQPTQGAQALRATLVVVGSRRGGPRGGRWDRGAMPCALMPGSLRHGAQRAVRRRERSALSAVVSLRERRMPAPGARRGACASA